ncbi:hypothetical protein CEXT_706811 [Caerostris extrusa]|uniref:Uncharacterized protein n=1 Tax=Caerostris extrusa TaxID=172846 RepID=A0AAV4PX29_CAEEX|nr:hypothetical protein CEXT_706811 [Caerostris extrusa]
MHCKRLRYLASSISPNDAKEDTNQREGEARVHQTIAGEQSPNSQYIILDVPTQGNRLEYSAGLRSYGHNTPKCKVVIFGIRSCTRRGVQPSKQL